MSRNEPSRSEDGFTLIELIIGISILAAVIISVFSLFVTLMGSMTVARNKAVATTLATNQMEYLKGLPYDSLAVAGGSIYSPSPLPASSTQTLNGVKYTVKTSINYIDDAYDGCTNYPSLALKQLYCRNYPPPSGAPAVDSNPADYKVIHVTVTNAKGGVLAEVDTQVAARVAETSSTTGALLATVIDDNGNPVSGATIAVVNTTLTPNVNLSDNTDSNGVAIFYGLPPDSGNDYIITASKSGYSTLNTIAVSGTLQPVYPNQKIVAQQSSSVTLTIKPQGSPSLLIEAVDTNGTPISGLKVYAKGGYKKYTATTDTSYYYDNLSPDSRPTTDSGGLAAISGLVPGSYYFCGDAGATSCAVGGTTYYLVAALPYTGDNSFYPMDIPTYDPSSPPATTFAYGGANYLQKVRLVFSTISNFPRVATLSPSNITLASTSLSSFAFQVTGTNLPCSSSAASCGTTVRFTQASSTYTASCTGTSGALLNCTVNLTGITAGFLQTTVIANTRTLTTPVAPPLGGISVSP
jgi:MSHA pilin protein MshD